MDTGLCLPSGRVSAPSPPCSTRGVHPTAFQTGGRAVGTPVVGSSPGRRPPRLPWGPALRTTGSENSTQACVFQPVSLVSVGIEELTTEFSRIIGTLPPPEWPSIDARMPGCLVQSLSNSTAKHPPAISAHVAPIETTHGPLAV